MTKLLLNSNHENAVKYKITRHLFCYKKLRLHEPVDSEPRPLLLTNLQAANR